MMDIQMIIVVCILALLRPVLSQVRPLPLTWSTSKFGPDGPWQAVTINVGTAAGSSSISLYPGGAFDSNFLVKDFCNGTMTGCNAAAGGLYNIEYSPSADFRSISEPSGTTTWGSGYPMNITGQSVFTLDTLKVGSTTTTFEIDQAIFASVINSNIAMPNGSSYPVWLGSLALGSPNPVQSFPLGNGSSITGQLLTGNLRNNNEIPSSSFGLHIGSANLGQPGSLILGGYDRSRVVGPVATYDIVGRDGRPTVNLIDINIGVQTGGTPFNVTTIPSVYTAGGNKSTSVVLNPLVPYMSLPPDTCAAMARWLPITYKPSIGLYTWNTEDYRYKSIISSPSYLAFTIQESGNNNITIKVPFSLLNLTLESPIVATPTQYFPCHPWTSNDGYWYLGRAFLQAAYLSMNWEQAKFSIGQATGPGMGPTSLQNIEPTDVSIIGGDISGFQDSWSSTWTVIPTNASLSGSNGLNGSAIPSPATDLGPKAGLSQSTQIGIGVGAGLGGAILLALLVLLCLTRRRRKQRAAAALEEAERLKQEQVRIERHRLQFQADHEEAERQQAIRAARFEKSEWLENGYGGGEYPPDHKHPYNFGHFLHELAVPPNELDAPHAIHEAPQTQRIFHEAPTGEIAHEAPSDEIAHEIDSTEITSPGGSRSLSRSLTRSSTSNLTSGRTTPRSTHQLIFKDKELPPEPSPYPYPDHNDSEDKLTELEPWKPLFSSPSSAKGRRRHQHHYSTNRPTYSIMSTTTTATTAAATDSRCVSQQYGPVSALSPRGKSGFFSDPCSPTSNASPVSFTSPISANIGGNNAITRSPSTLSGPSPATPGNYSVDMDMSIEAFNALSPSTAVSPQSPVPVLVASPLPRTTSSLPGSARVARVMGFPRGPTGVSPQSPVPVLVASPLPMSVSLPGSARAARVMGFPRGPKEVSHGSHGGSGGRHSQQ